MTRSLTAIAVVLLALPVGAQQISTGTLAANVQQNESYDSQDQVTGDVPGLELGEDITDVRLLLFPPDGVAEGDPAPVERTGQELSQPTTGLATVEQVE